MNPPGINFIPRFIQGSKPVLIQAFVSEFTIQTFNECILRWFPWLDEIDPHLVFFAPEEHRLTGKLGRVLPRFHGRF